MTSALLTELVQLQAVATLRPISAPGLIHKQGMILTGYEIREPLEVQEQDPQ